MMSVVIEGVFCHLVTPDVLEELVSGETLRAYKEYPNNEPELILSFKNLSIIPDKSEHLLKSSDGIYLVSAEGKFFGITIPSSTPPEIVQQFEALLNESSMGLIYREQQMEEMKGTTTGKVKDMAKTAYQTVTSSIAKTVTGTGTTPQPEQKTTFGRVRDMAKTGLQTVTGGTPQPEERSTFTKVKELVVSGQPEPPKTGVERVKEVAKSGYHGVQAMVGVSPPPEPEIKTPMGRVKEVVESGLHGIQALRLGGSKEAEGTEEKGIMGKAKDKLTGTAKGIAATTAVAGVATQVPQQKSTLGKVKDMAKSGLQTVTGSSAQPQQQQGTLGKVKDMASSGLYAVKGTLQGTGESAAVQRTSTKPPPSKRIANGIEWTSEKAELGIVAGAILLGSGIKRAEATLENHTKPCSRPSSVSPSTLRFINQSKSASTNARQASTQVADLVESSIQQIAQETVEVLNKRPMGRKIVSSSVANGVFNITRASLIAVGNIFEGVVTAGLTVASDTAQATSSFVHHKHGEVAGTAADDAVKIVDDIGHVMRNSIRMRPKNALRGGAIRYVKARTQGQFGENKENRPYEGLMQKPGQLEQQYVMQRQAQYAAQQPQYQGQQAQPQYQGQQAQPQYQGAQGAGLYQGPSQYQQSQPQYQGPSYQPQPQYQGQYQSEQIQPQYQSSSQYQSAQSQPQYQGPSQYQGSQSSGQFGQQQYPSKQYEQQYQATPSPSQFQGGQNPVQYEVSQQMPGQQLGMGMQQPEGQKQAYVRVTEGLANLPSDQPVSFIPGGFQS